MSQDYSPARVWCGPGQWTVRMDVCAARVAEVLVLRAAEISAADPSVEEAAALEAAADGLARYADPDPIGGGPDPTLLTALASSLQGHPSEITASLGFDHAVLTLEAYAEAWEGKIAYPRDAYDEVEIPFLAAPPEPTESTTHTAD